MDEFGRVVPPMPRIKGTMGPVLLRTDREHNRAHSIEIKRVGHEDGGLPPMNGSPLFGFCAKRGKVARGDDRAESMTSSDRVEHPEFE